MNIRPAMRLVATGLLMPLVLWTPVRGSSAMNCSDLLQAAQTNDTASLRQALGADVSVDCRNHHRQTALLVATIYNSVEAARMLIEAGADVNAQDDRQDSPLLYAGAEGRLDILRLCLKAKPNFKVYNRYGESR